MYLIDGHNLIPNVRGLALNQIDDEEALVKLLQKFAWVSGKAVEVFFDDAPPAQAGKRSYGMVKATFIAASSTADAAITRRLAQLGKRAKEACVVTSDRQVQAEARNAGAKVTGADAFARELMLAQGASPAVRKGKKSAARKGRSTQEAGPQKTDPDEVAYWLEQFGAGDPNNPGKKPRG